MGGGGGGAEDDVVIRPVGDGEAERVSYVVNHAYRSGELGGAEGRSWVDDSELIRGMRTSPGKVAQSLASGTLLLVAVETATNTIIGCIKLEPYNTGDANARTRPASLRERSEEGDNASLPVPNWEVGMLAVLPRCQKQGLGKRLLAAAEEELRRRGEKTAVLAHMSHAKITEWYQRRGYRLTGDSLPANEIVEKNGEVALGEVRFVYLAKAL
eukprot:jgi/Chlat1/7797/Chrsp66S07251